MTVDIGLRRSRQSADRRLPAATTTGLPVIVLTSVGAKSGALRKNVLMRVEHDGQYAVVGSRRGLPRNPDWVDNLRKHCHFDLQDGPEKHDYSARELTGSERAIWWGRALTAFSDYAEIGFRRRRISHTVILRPRACGVVRCHSGHVLPDYQAPDADEVVAVAAKAHEAVAPALRQSGRSHTGNRRIDED